MANEKISQYTTQATSLSAGDKLDVSKLISIGPDVYETQWFDADILASGIISVTRAEAQALRDDGDVKKGQLYLFTDAPEEFIVMGTNLGDFGTQVVSPAHPYDVIYFDMNDTDSANWFVSYRLDTTKKLSAYYDWRNITFTRWETALGNGTYLAYDDPGGGEASQEFYTFGNVINTAGNVYTPAVNGSGGDNEHIHLEYGTNIVFGSGNSYIHIGKNHFKNTFGNNCSNWEIGAYFFFNVFKSNSQFNVIGDSASGNVTGTAFTGNIMGNDFLSNVIGNNFQKNTAPRGFQSNIVGNNCMGNYFNKDFNSVTLAADYKNNISDADVSFIDLSGATIVYNTYTKRIVSRSDGSLRLHYLDNTDTIIYADITD